MIQFPELDLKDTNIRVLLFVISMFLLFLGNLSVNYLVSFLIVLFVVLHFQQFKKTLYKDILVQKKQIATRYNNKIDSLLSSLKNFKKYSPQSYRLGKHYWKLFIQKITMLENEKLHHYNPHFDKAHHYLQKSVNAFHSMGVSAQEEKYIHALELNNFVSSKHLRKISQLAKDLHEEGYHLLYTLSLRYNKQWKENPSIHNHEIVFDYPLPHERDVSKHYDFLL
jgi:Fe-S cluster biosynthesis and repair protein YggX